MKLQSPSLTTLSLATLGLIAILSPTLASANPAQSTAPNLTISNPTGFGASDGTVYTSVSYQSRTRFGNKSDAEASVGIGFGDAKNVALEVNYAINSFGTGNNGGKFGDGGFSAKVHKQFGDDFSAAVGYNQFATIGNSDYQKGSYYVVGTKVFATKDDIEQPFSRVAVTAGVGGGVFNGFKPTDNPNKVKPGVGAFGSVALRVTNQISIIGEYTGQDFAAGVSVVPFKDVPLTITPAVRDLGSKDRPRFVLGATYGFKF
jgi:hypothetical protein